MQMVEHHPGQAAFEAAQGFGLGVAGGLALAVVGLSEAVEADLGDGDAVQSSVEC